MRKSEYRNKLNELRSDSYIQKLLGKVRRLAMPSGEARNKIELYVVSHVDSKDAGLFTVSNLVEDITSEFSYSERYVMKHGLSGRYTPEDERKKLAAFRKTVLAGISGSAMKGLNERIKEPQ